MDKSIKDKLLSCRSYDDAKPILETVSLGQSAHELARTAFSIHAKQPTVANQFLKTVIQEMEDEEKKISEVDGGQSEQSSSTTGLEKIGSEEDAAESFHDQSDKKDQMGVAINESQGFMPPQQMPPQQQSHGGCGQMGQMPPQAQQMTGGMSPQQFQFAINETVKNALKPMQEAIKQLDKKIQETTREQPKSLDLGSQMGNGKKSFASIKETTGNPKQDLESARQEITKMNNYLNSGRY